MISSAKETYRMIGSNLKHLFLFELIYRLMTMPLYLGLLDQSIKFSLKMAGYSYLTAGNIGMFLIKPWTLLCIAVLGVLGLLLLLVEIAGLITAFQAAAYSRKPGVVELFTGGLLKLRDEFRKKNWRLLPLVMIHYILIQLFVVYRFFIHIKPVSFMITEMLNHPLARLAVAVLLVMLMLLAVPTVFVFHTCMVEQKSFRDGVRRSLQLLSGHVVRTTVLLTVLDGVMVAGMLAIYVVCVFVTAVCVVLFADGNMALAVLLSSCDSIEMTLLFAASIALVITNFAATTVLYYQYGSHQDRVEAWEFPYSGRKVRSRKMAAGMVCGLCLLSIVYIYDVVRNGFAVAGEVLTEIQITAHRGSSRTAPENTMAALAAAVEELADYAEIDVQESVDGQVVLVHDTSLKRVAGVNRSVGSMTFEELQVLDVGSWFGDRYAGERIPALTQVMEYCKGKINLNIEIKNMGKSSVLPEKVLDIIHEYGMVDQCVVTSTNLGYLVRLKELEPDIRTGYIVSAAYGDYYSNESVDFISIRSSFVNSRLMAAAHEKGKAIHAWTVNSKSEMERLKLLGVDNIITDYPVMARETVYGAPVQESLLEYLRVVLK